METLSPTPKNECRLSQRSSPWRVSVLVTLSIVVLLLISSQSPDVFVTPPEVSKRSTIYTEIIYTNDTQMFNQISWIKPVPAEPDFKVPTHWLFPETAICLAMNLVSRNWICPLEGNWIYVSLRLEYQFQINHTGWVELEHTITGSGPAQLIETRLLNSHDEYNVSMRPVFILEVLRTEPDGTPVQTHTIEFPFLALEDVDGGNNGLNISPDLRSDVEKKYPGSNLALLAVDDKIYYWDEFAYVGNLSVDNQLGQVHDITRTIPLVDYPLLELLEEIAGIFPALKPYKWIIKIIRMLIDIRLQFSIDPIAQIQNMVQTLVSTASPSHAYESYVNVDDPTQVLRSEGGMLAFSDPIDDADRGSNAANRTIEGNGSVTHISIIPSLYWNVNTDVSYSANLVIVQPDGWIAGKFWKWLKLKPITIPIAAGLFATSGSFIRYDPLPDSWSSYPRTFGTAGSNTPPSVSFQSSTSVGIDTSLLFDASGTTDADGDSLWYRFNFGDGNASELSLQSMVTHSFDREGIFQATVSVFDGIELVTSSAVAITVGPSSDSPVVANLSTSTPNIVVSGTAIFDASTSAVNDPGSALYYMDYGDGNDSGWIATTAFSHQYTTAGSYQVLLIVNDGTGADFDFTKMNVIDPNDLPSNQILVVIDEGGQETGPLANSEIIFSMVGKLTEDDIVDFIIVGDNDGDGVIDDPTADGPNNISMHRYQVVIWTTGLASTNTLTATDQLEINKYWTSGGAIWLIGQDILADLYPAQSTFTGGTFAYDTLGIDGADQDAGMANYLVGDSSTNIFYNRIASGMNITTQNIVDNVTQTGADRADNLSFRSGFSVPLFNTSTTATDYLIQGVLYPHASNGTLIFYPFELAAIVDPYDLDDLVLRTLISLFDKNDGDDNFTTADEIYLGMSDWTWDIVGESSDADSTEDYFALWVPQGVGFSIDMWISDYPTDNFDLYLYNCKNSTCLINSDTGTNQLSTVGILSAGTGYYYVRVAAISGTGYYFLRVNTFTDGNDDLSDATNVSNTSVVLNSTYEQVVMNHYDPSDFYSINLTAGDYLTVALEWEDPDADIDLYIYDPDLAVVAYSSSYNDPFEEAGWQAPSTGTYFILVNAYSVNSWTQSGHYTMTVDVITPEPPDGADDNLTSKLLRVTGFYYYNLTLDSIFDPEDWYSIYLYEGEQISFYFIGAEQGTDFDLELYYNGGQRIDNVSAQRVATSYDLGTLDDRIDYTVFETGWYYINILAYSGRGYYWLQISDNNDYYDNAYEVFAGMKVQGALYNTTARQLDEWDGYRISLFKDEIIQITMNATAPTADYDLYLVSYDGTIEIVLNSSTSPNDADEYLTWRVNVTDEYYIWAYARNGTGHYELQINVSFQPNQPPAYLGGLGNQAVVEGAEWSLDLDDFFSDPDGDPLVITANNPTVTIDPATNIASWTPPVGAGDLVGLIFTADDGEFQVAAPPIDISVLLANQPPIFTGTITDATLAPNEIWTLDLDLFFTDPDGDSLSFVTNYQSDITIDDQTHIASWMATGNLTAVVVSCSDGEFSVDSNVFNLSVEYPPLNSKPIYKGGLAGGFVAVNEIWSADLDLYFSDNETPTSLIFSAVPLLEV